MPVQASKRDSFGVYVGRFSPLHLGHQVLIDKLLEAYGERHLILVGSCNHGISFRHLFTYNDRCEFIRTVYPQARVTGLPDFDDDEEWFSLLDDTLALHHVSPDDTTFIGGCHEDIEFFIDRGRNVEIINRFDGTSPRISATEVRDALIEHRTIEGLVDPRIIEIVRQRFDVRWAALRKK